MNSYQAELVRLLKILRCETEEIGQKNPNLLPALYSKGSELNDPETDRLIESFGCMMSQSNVNFALNLETMTDNDLSGFLPEWFEPAVSSLILKANIDVWKNWSHIKFLENTRFCSSNSSDKNNVLFSNDLPVIFDPIEIQESCFTYYNGIFSAVLKLNALANIEKIGKLNIFFDYSKFRFYYRFLDEVIYVNKPIEIHLNNKILLLNKDKVKYSFSDVIDKSIYSADNYTYYLYHFVNYMNNYCFLNFDMSELNISLKEKDKFEIIIPLNNYFKEMSEIMSFAYTNCFATKNYSIESGDPIYLMKDQSPYLILDRASKKNFIGIDKIIFYNRDHSDLKLIKNIHYDIIKKYIIIGKSVDIVFYLNIKKAMNEDIIILPYFKYSDLLNAHNIQINTDFILKRNSNFKFTSLTTPTKTVFYIDHFKSMAFYSNIFLINNSLVSENLSLNYILQSLKLFSDISQYYRGIISKIIEQIKQIEEINDKSQIHNEHGCFLHRRYNVILEVNKQTYSFGGISILIKFIETLLNKASKINSQYIIQLRFL